MLQSFADLEISLLNWQWSPTYDLPNKTTELFKSACEGNYKDALNSEIAKELLALQSDATLDLEKTSLTTLFRFTVQSLSDTKEIELARLAVSITCLHAFLQENWTGPPMDIELSKVLSTSVPEVTLNARSIKELALGGEPAYHLAKLPILLRVSQLLLDLPYQHLKTAS